ncbi:MAG: serine/threonine protein kinase [Deltaproteobacteria bacterium]|nr:serine/threonine protein kinase [Deltaproteobacteria bacterium]
MQPGDTIGKYRLVSRLGRGGMGEVWLANASGYGGFTKTVVLKTLLPELADDPLFIEMLAHEALICSKLSHPNLIEVFDFTEHDGVYLLAMEHVPGQPLSHILKAARARNWGLPVWFALRVILECCRGLECAHDQGIIHCDLSPSNVMVTFTGVTKILDFGVAHSSARGTKPDRLKGKYPYMAPERMKSLTTDRRTDVYALGVMLYLLTTGRLPYGMTNDAELLMKITQTTPPLPSAFCTIAPEVEQVILRAMQRDPAARYQTIGDLLAAVTHCLAGELGKFGQHDVAALVGSLLDDPDAAVPPLPPIPPRPRAPRDHDHTADARQRHGDGIDELHSVDVVIESSVMELSYDDPPTPAPEVFVSDARASSPLVPPLVTAFESSAGWQEARTSVQSLFGDRPPAFGHSRIFDRPSLDRDAPHEDAALGSDPGSPPIHPVMYPGPRAPSPDLGATRSVFGGDASTRPAAPSIWPWPTSRKSE